MKGKKMTKADIEKLLDEKFAELKETPVKNKVKIYELGGQIKLLLELARKETL